MVPVRTRSTSSTVVFSLFFKSNRSTQSKAFDENLADLPVRIVPVVLYASADAFFHHVR